MAQPNTVGSGVTRPAHWRHLLTERSMKFYDGTYTWIGTDAFLDEHGIRHNFGDPNDPEGYPPTPRPVSPGSDYEMDVEGIVDLPGSPAALATPRSLQADLESSKSPRSSDEVRYLSLRSVLPSTFLQQPFSTTYAFSLDGSYEKILLRPNLFADKSEKERQRLLGRLEGILVGQWAEKTGLSLEECYNLCDIHKDDILAAIEKDVPNGIASGEHLVGQLTVDSAQTAVSIGSVPLLNPRTPSLRGGMTRDELSDKACHSLSSPAASEEQGNAGSNSEGSLTDCPSDLSEWDVYDQIKKHSGQTDPRTLAKHKELRDADNNDLGDSKKDLKTSKKKPAAGRGSSADSGVGGISIRRRSARHAKAGQVLGISGSIAI